MRDDRKIRNFGQGMHCGEFDVDCRIRVGFQYRSVLFIVPGFAEAKMKRTALAIGFSLVALQAHAISRYNPTSMSCARVQDTIQREGAAIMRYAGASGLPLYDRYVANRTFCRADEVLETDYIPSADRASCPVNACIEYEFLHRSRRH